MLAEQLYIDANYQAVTATHILSVQNDWELACGENKYLSVAYLKAIEQSAIPAMQYVYVVVYKNAQPIGVAYFQRVHISSDFFLHKKFPNEIKGKNRLQLLKKINGNLLLCGNLFATGVNGFYFRDTSTEVVLPVLANQLIQKLNTTSLKVNFLMYKEFWEDQNQSLQNEFKCFTKKFQIDVNMVLPIQPQWESFALYLESMKTKYRTRAKNVYKKTEELEVKAFSATDIQAHKKDIDKLFSSVLETASFHMVKPNAESFYQLKKALEDNFKFTSYFLDGKLVAFSTGFLNNHYLDANYVGIDYQVNNKYPLYQRLLYDFVSMAIENKVKELRLGRTAEIMKSSLGAVPVGMNLYAKHTNIVLNTFLSPLLNYVKPSKYEIRAPFKK